MEELFRIENFNIIQDEENYYFFRALNMADNRDVEERITLDEDGKIARIRTDRERYIENPENGTPKYNAEDEISLEQVHDHIKMHYRKDTNCISLASDANVVIDYGRGNYKDRYVMVKIPKKEMGDNVKFAGEYMLEEIEKKVNEYISSLNPNDERDSLILQELDKIENSQSTEEIKEIVKTTYKGEIDISKSGLRQGIQYRAPVSRFSEYQTLNEEQNLAKNKLVGKLTLLERKDDFKRILPHANNSNVLKTIGSAFSSMELIHYGDIPGEEIQEVPSKIMDMFSLIQQVKVDLPNVNELKNELVKYVNNGMQFSIPEDSLLNREDKVKDNLTIEEMYNLTAGRVAYGNANSIIKNVFYLAKSQARARELANVLNQITGNNPKYAEVIDYIAKNGFEIEPEAITRHSNRGYQISEAVSLDLKKNETTLVEEIKKFTNEELLQIMQRGGLSDTRGIITNTFSEVQEDEKIRIDDYYAEAIIDLYDWQKLGIEEFTIEQRNDLIQKLKESDCVSIYKKLKDAEIPEKDIPKYTINLASKEHLKNILNEENYVELIKQNEQELKQELSIPQIETYLGYYAVDGTELVLRDYQRNAVVKTDEIFENKKFASVVLPTGGGKSFVALTELMEHKDEKMLYLAPSNEILEQMKDYVIEYVHGLQGTLGEKDKMKIIKKVFPNITFETYQGLLDKKGKNVINQEYGFIVLDELHRTGASKWEEKLDELLENQQENVKVLGITATPTRDMDDRNMANETALKLGYTPEEVQKRKHIAMDMDLVEAIKLGLVVNPKIVSCEYSLKEDGRMEDLLEAINSIEDENVRKEKLAKYEQLRRSLDNAQGIPEILQSNVKPGGKYIVFIPVTDKNVDLEDEDGNKIGKKSGEDKIKEYEQKIKEYLKNSGINPKCYSMLGAYSDKKNEAQLKSFETDESEDTKFMIVMNKANEGLHVKGIDGIIWFRALDENSKILYLQQLGRAIYSEDPNNPTPDEKRPVVIDLVNNTLNVDIDKDIKNNNRLDDLQLLSVVVDWVKMHNGLPDIDSTNKTEQRYAATLYRIQNKYQDYLNGFENYPDLDEKKKTQIQAIIEKGLEIDLWDTQLPTKSAEDIDKIINVDTFKIKSQLLRDLVELENEVDEQNRKNAIGELLEIARKLNARGIDLHKVNLSKSNNGKQVTILLKDIQQKGIDIEKIIQEEELEENFQLGEKMHQLRKAYNGNGDYSITEEQKKEAEKLGLIPDKRNLLNIARILNENGADLKKIQLQKKSKTILLREINQEGIDIKKIIEDNGLNGEFHYGEKVIDFRKKYNKKGKYKNKDVLTEEEKKEAEELGLVKTEKKSAATTTLEIARILNENGVDFSKVQLSKDGKNFLLKEIKQNGLDIQKIIEDNNLDGEYGFGIQVKRIRQGYTESGNVKLTEKERKEAEELGLVKTEKKSAATTTLEIARILNENGVDFSKVQLSKDGKNFLLKEIKQNGLDIQKIIEDNNLDENFDFGGKVARLRQAYNGTARKRKLSEEEKKKAEELGLVIKEKKNAMTETLDISQVLKANGVDLSKIIASKKISGKDVYILLKEIKQEGIDIDKIIEDNGLDGGFKYGYRISNLRIEYNKAVNGKRSRITEEQIKIAEELGLIKVKRLNSQNIGETGFEVGIGDIDKFDEAEKVLENLVEKEKEGGKNKENT